MITRQSFLKTGGALTLLAVGGCLNPRARIASDVAAFARTIRGQVLTPSDAGYEEARTTASFNPRFDRRPLVIARCADENDSAKAIAFARAAQLPLAVRSGGHDVLAASVCDGGVVIDTALMATIAPPENGASWIGAGARAGAITAALAEHGHAATLGCNPGVGIGGLVLGGGFGWFIGSRGASCDTLRAARVVTADGTMLTASESETPDLFWALRGGGGNFGVVTALQMETHRQGDVSSGVIAYRGEQLAEFLAFYREYMREAPDNLAVELVVLSHHRPTILALICHSGPEAEAQAALRPLRRFGPPIADGVVRRPFADQGVPDEISALFAWPGYNPRNEPASPGSYWQGGVLDEISDGAIAAIVQQTHSAPAGWSFGLGHYVHGAAARVAPEATPLLRVSGASYFHFDGGWDVASPGQELMSWIDASMAAMAPYAGAADYVNYLSSDIPARVRAAYGPHYARLAALKRRYDPDNVFRGNRNIVPA